MITSARRRVRWGLAKALLWAALAAPSLAAAEMPVPGDISPEAQAFYRQLRSRPAASMDLADPAVLERLRTGLGRMFLGFARKIRTDYSLEPVDAGGVPAVWVRTPAPVRKGKVLLYIHGGGFILGSAQTDLALPLRIGPAAGMAVLSVDYRLAPEHPFPAATDDVLAAYRWLLKQGYKGRDIGVFGDSAGGALALSLVLSAREAGLALPAAVVALSPVTDLTDAGDTRTTLAAFDPVLSGDGTSGRAAYLGGHDAREPLVSPLFGDLQGFPPLLIQAGTREILLSDSVRFARKARAAGVDVTLDVWEGMWHVWQVNPDVPEARAAAEVIAAFFQQHTGPGRR